MSQARHRSDVGGDLHAIAPGPLTKSVPSMRTSAASVAFSQCEHSATTCAGSSLTSDVNDIRSSASAFAP